jgi:hypothetical protein
MTRRIVEHEARNFDGEVLQVVCVYEPGMKKEDIKKIDPFSKKHQVLYFKGDSYEFKN